MGCAVSANSLFTDCLLDRKIPGDGFPSISLWIGSKRIQSFSPSSEKFWFGARFPGAIVREFQWRCTQCRASFNAPICEERSSAANSTSLSGLAFSNIAISPSAKNSINDFACFPLISKRTPPSAVWLILNGSGATVLSISTADTAVAIASDEVGSKSRGVVLSKD